MRKMIGLLLSVCMLLCWQGTAWAEGTMLPDFGAFADVAPIYSTAPKDGGLRMVTYAQGVDRVNAFARAMEEAFSYRVERERVAGGELIRFAHALAPGFSVTVSSQQRIAVFTYPGGAETGPLEAVQASFARTLPYPFRDAAMEACLRGLLDRPEGDVTRAELSGLRALDLPAFAQREAIVDYGDLAALTGLRTLDLSGQPIADLSCLQGLTGLESLDLSGTGVQDLRPLSGLTRLTALDVSRTAVRDLGPLAKMERLAVLRAAEAELSNVSVLAQLPALKEADLSSNRIQYLPDLSGLASLAVLRVDGNEISNLSPLARCPALEALYANDNRIRNIDPLVHMPQLREVELWYNDLASLDPLEKREGPPLSVQPSFVMTHAPGGPGEMVFTTRSETPPLGLRLTAQGENFITPTEADSGWSSGAAGTITLAPLGRYDVLAQATAGGECRARVTVPLQRYRESGYATNRSALFLLPTGVPSDGFYESYYTNQLGDLSAAKMTQGQVRLIAEGRQQAHVYVDATMNRDEALTFAVQYLLETPEGLLLYQEGESYTVPGARGERVLIDYDVSALFEDLHAAAEDQPVTPGRYTLRVLYDHAEVCALPFEIL